MMLRINYLPASYLIEISTEGDNTYWPHIRRIFHEEYEEFVTTFSDTLRVPVWIFLNYRPQLSYVLRKYKIELKVDDGIREILDDAKRRSQLYNEARKATPWREEDLVRTLKERGFCRNLTHEQIRNLTRLAALPSGATFSVPGAGKTTEALAYYYLTRSNDDRLLVVSPKNAFAAWEEQIKLCLEDPPEVIRLTGGLEAINELLSKKPPVALITYAQLPNVKPSIGAFLSRHRTYMFLDESHHIKRGHTGVWGTTVLDLSHLPVAKLIMSGTPLPNSVDDLNAQFYFLYPEVEVGSNDIRKLIQPIFVRTTKDELGLPEVRRTIIKVPMLPKQRQLYELFRSEEARLLRKLPSIERINLRSFGKSVMRLLQLTSNPALLARDEIEFPNFLFEVLDEGDSPKLAYACSRARELAFIGKKSIIWSGFVQNVETIANRLKDLGADFIHGGVEAGSAEESDTRERKIKNFHDNPNNFVLVANPAACAEGISLHTVCHNAIYLDRNFNAAQYLQSEDRIHRLGLAPNQITEIEILMTPASIDERVNHRLQIKVDRMARVLNDPSLNISPVTTDLDDEGVDHEDIEEMIGHFLGE